MNPDLLAELADSTDAVVLALVVRWQAGDLTDAEFVALATAALQRAQAEGVAVADLAVATVLGVGALGLLPDAEAPTRAEQAVARIVAKVSGFEFVPNEPGRASYVEQLRAELAEPGHDRSWYSQRNTTLRVMERVSVETRAEVLGTGQKANATAVRRHGARWTRSPNSGACEVCTDLAKNIGGSLPADTPMWTHRGCACAQRPVATRQRQPEESTR